MSSEAVEKDVRPRVAGKTKVVGIFGDPVEHSLSPSMHNRAFLELGLDYVYIPFHVRPKNLAAAVRGATALGLVGFNLTIPHKREVVALVDELSPEAELIGAVNTVVLSDGRLIGHNTDGQGFVRSLREEAGFDPAGRHVIVLGAGGAAQAVVVQLLLEGAATLTIVNRTAAKGERLADAVSRRFASPVTVAGYDSPELGPALEQADLIVNATPVGMAPRVEEMPPIPLDRLSPGCLVSDLVYTPMHTQLVRTARAKGCAALPGLGMLLFQGAQAFELWTGRAAPVDVMRQTLVERLVG